MLEFYPTHHHHFHTLIKDESNINLPRDKMKSSSRECADKEGTDLDQDRKLTFLPPFIPNFCRYWNKEWEELRNLWGMWAKDPRQVPDEGGRWELAWALSLVHRLRRKSKSLVLFSEYQAILQGGLWPVRCLQIRVRVWTLDPCTRPGWIALHPPAPLNCQ